MIPVSFVVSAVAMLGGVTNAHLQGSKPKTDISYCETYEVTQGNWRFKLEIAAFRKESHKLEFDEAHSLKSIDGHQAHGPDGAIPIQEVKSLVAFYRGKRLTIPKKMYSDCYNPFVVPEAPENKLKLSVFGAPKPKAVFRLRTGSGAGIYFVEWTLSPTRFIGRQVREFDEDRDSP